MAFTAAIKLGSRVRLKACMPDAGREGEVVALDRYQVTVRFDDGGEQTFAKGTSVERIGC